MPVRDICVCVITTIVTFGSILLSVILSFDHKKVKLLRLIHTFLKSIRTHLKKIINYKRPASVISYMTVIDK